jgi:hypothetical protein
LLIQYCANQLQRGNVSPARYNLIINQAQLGFLNYLLGQFQQYNYGKPNSRVQFGVNETVRQRLTPLIGPLSTLTIDGTGLSPYPAGFQQVDAMLTTTMQRVRFVPQHKLYSYLNDSIDPIATNPIYTIESDGFKFYPATLGSALISFVGTPPDIVWAYTLDGQQRPQYSSGSSVAPIWYDADMYEIISRALAMVGVNLSAPEVTQYADMIIKQGQ